MNAQDAQLKAQMMAEAEEAIEDVLRKRKPTDEIKLSEIEELARELGQRLMAGVSQALVTASADKQEEGLDNKYKRGMIDNATYLVAGTLR
ncbi:MAG: hypothetical protein ACUVSF_09045 [Anaerolineae bacterium]